MTGYDSTYGPAGAFPGVNGQGYHPGHSANGYAHGDPAPGDYGPSGYGPNGHGPNGPGPSGHGPSGYGPTGYGPTGYGPQGYGQPGYGDPAFGGMGYPHGSPYGQPSPGPSAPETETAPGLYRWVFSYFLSCLLATPIIMTGVILSFGATKVLGQYGFAMGVLVCMTMLPLFLAVIMIAGILPTVPTHFTLKGWGRTDALSYFVGGFAAWGLFGFFLAVLAEVSVELGTRNAEAESTVSMLGLTMTIALSGAIILVLIWTMVVRGTGPDEPPADDSGSGSGSGRGRRQRATAQARPQPRQQRPAAYDPQVPFL